MRKRIGFSRASAVRNKGVLRHWVFVPAVAVAVIAGRVAHAWDAHGHRVITYLALDACNTDPHLPAWLRETEVRRRIAYQSSEPDRWRGQRTAQLINENNMDHYFDVEDLEPYGMTLREIPRLRTRFLAQMAATRAAHPERWPGYDAAKDPAGDKEFPGFVPHAIMEHYAKLQASFRTLRILEAQDDPEKRAAQLEQARANVIYHIGVLSHFVGDTAQPLHTTRHFNGWAPPPGLEPAAAESTASRWNPHGYTTSNRFHAYIDGGVLELHTITYESLLPMWHSRGEERCVSTSDPWEDVLAHIERSFAHMETLYKMEKDGTLDAAPGKKLIEERLIDGADMLAAMIKAAWLTSEPEGMEIRRFSAWTPAE